MSRFRWGIFGTGAISAKFAAGLATAQDSEVSFVASRSGERALSFVRALRLRAVAGTHDEALASNAIDAAYIATPPSEHVALAIRCIETGIPVLIEKPLAMTASDAKRLVDCARGNSVFAMEAMWTRFLPSARAMRDHLAAKTVGVSRVISGNFGTSQFPDPANGMFNPTLGGGVLSHLAPYPLSLAQWMLGNPVSVQAVGTFGREGVDETVALQLVYPGNVLGVFFASIRAWAPDQFLLSGSAGMIEFKGSIVRPHGLEITRQSPRLIEVMPPGWKELLKQNAWIHRIAQWTGRSSRRRGARQWHAYAGNGYQYEANEVRACVLKGKCESLVMPLDDSLSVAVTIDQIREILKNQARNQEVNS